LYDIKRFAPANVNKLLIGNKSDLVIQRVVNYMDAMVSQKTFEFVCYQQFSSLYYYLPLFQRFADQRSIPFRETSANQC
jgi:hypothetical protein